MFDTNQTAKNWQPVIGGLVNASVLYAGSAEGLWLRTSSSGALTRLTTYSGATPKQIVLDPDDWHIAYLMGTNGHIWRTTDAGADDAVDAIRRTVTLNRQTITGLAPGLIYFADCVLASLTIVGGAAVTTPPLASPSCEMEVD